MTDTYEDDQFEDLIEWFDDFLDGLESIIDEIDKEIEEKEHGKLGS